MSAHYDDPYAWEAPRRRRTLPDAEPPEPPAAPVVTTEAQVAEAIATLRMRRIRVGQLGLGEDTARILRDLGIDMDEELDLEGELPSDQELRK